MQHQNPVLSYTDFTLYQTHEHCLLSLNTAHQSLSSAILAGGLQDSITHVLNMKVSGASADEPASQTLKHYAQQLGIKHHCVGMMTSASMDSLAFDTQGFEHLGFTAIVTAGLSNALRAGDQADYVEYSGKENLPSGTINTVLISHQPLSSAAMAEALMMMTEAKAACLQALQVTSKLSSAIATGTGTDTCVVLAPIAEHGLSYVGKHTKAGELLANSVLNALAKSLEWYQHHGRLHRGIEPVPRQHANVNIKP